MAQRRRECASSGLERDERDGLYDRHVRIVESYQAPPVVYRGLKVLGEVLNVPAKLLNKGHDMLVFLRRV